MKLNFMKMPIGSQAVLSLQLFIQQPLEIKMVLNERSYDCCPKLQPL